MMQMVHPIGGEKANLKLFCVEGFGGFFWGFAVLWGLGFGFLGLGFSARLGASCVYYLCIQGHLTLPLPSSSQPSTPSPSPYNHLCLHIAIIIVVATTFTIPHTTLALMLPLPLLLPSCHPSATTTTVVTILILSSLLPAANTVVLPSPPLPLS
jgi:hypothetical protein